MAKIHLAYRPRKWALPFHATEKRWIVIVAHRRAGKTTAALNFLQISALRNKDARYAYIAPTYKQAKNIAWGLLKQYSNCVPGVVCGESELVVKYPNGARITLYGADNPDSLRGMGLWGVVFDEYSQQPSNIFSEIIRPALADHNGYAIWIGTPKGKNEFYRLYEKAKDDPSWFALLLTIDDTRVIPTGEIESARRAMSPEEFLQEWYCSFEAAVKGAIYGTEIAEARKAGRIKSVAYDREALVHTVWDIGVGRNLAVGFYQKIGNEIHKIDYWEGVSDEGIADAIAVIKNKRYVYGKHFAPHDIKAKELTTGKTRLEAAEKLGIAFEIVRDISIEDGIDAVKRMFSRLWVDEESCQLWLDYIAQYQREWDEKKGMFKDSPRHDFTSHAADELRYAAIVEKEMFNERKRVKWIQPDYEPFSPLEFVPPKPRKTPGWDEEGHWGTPP